MPWRAADRFRLAAKMPGFSCHNRNADGVGGGDRTVVVNGSHKRADAIRAGHFEGKLRVDLRRRHEQNRRANAVEVHLHSVEVGGGIVAVGIRSGDLAVVSARLFPKMVTRVPGASSAAAAPPARAGSRCRSRFGGCAGAGRSRGGGRISDIVTVQPRLRARSGSPQKDFPPQYWRSQ